MEMYLNDKQEEIINYINKFLEINKKVILLENINMTDCAIIENCIASKIEKYLKENGFNIIVARYFNGKKFSNSKIEVLDKDNNNKPLGIYICTKRKLVDSRKETDDKIVTWKQVIYGEEKEIKTQYVREYKTYKYNLSMNYQSIILS